MEDIVNIKQAKPDDETVGGIQSFFIIPRAGLIKFKLKGLSYVEAELEKGSYFIKVQSRHKLSKCEYNINNKVCEFKISAYFNRQDSIKAFGLQLLMDAEDVVVVVYLNTGQGFVFGYDEAEHKNTYSVTPKIRGVFGVGFKDRYGYYLYLDGKQSQIPKPFIGSIPIKNNENEDELIELTEFIGQ